MKNKKYFGPFCMLLSSIMVIMVAQPLKATTINEEKEKQEQLQQNIDDAEAIIKELEQYKNDTAKYIEQLDIRMEDLTNYIIDLNQQITEKEEEIVDINETLKAQQEDIDEQYDAMKIRIKYMYENGQTEYLDMLLNSGNISEMLNKAEYLTKITEYDRDMLNKMKDTLAENEKTKATLVEEQENLNTLKSEAEAEQNEVEVLVDEKKKLLEDTEAQIADKVSSIVMMESQIAESQSVVAEIQEAERKAQEAERKRREAAAAAAAAAEAGNNGGSQSGGSTVDNYEPIYTGGKLNWPLPGYYTISSGYVYRINPVTGQAENHRGIDFPAPAGTPIVAAESGTVAWAYRSSSAGNWVGIAHGEGITTVYMHMSAYCVSEGDVVRAGQVIGYVGSTGQSTGNHLHFGVKVNGDYVNPSSYLGI